jgi:hypothetical protein
LFFIIKQRFLNSYDKVFCLTLCEKKKKGGGVKLKEELARKRWSRWGERGGGDGERGEEEVGRK